MAPVGKVTVTVATKPTVGVATHAGLAGALGQFVVAVVLIIQGDHSDIAVTALITATLTLLTVLGGRYAQAAVLARHFLSGEQTHVDPPA